MRKILIYLGLAWTLCSAPAAVAQVVVPAPTAFWPKNDNIKVTLGGGDDTFRIPVVRISIRKVCQWITTFSPYTFITLCLLGLLSAIISHRVELPRGLRSLEKGEPSLSESLRQYLANGILDEG